jgi:hypothetical protein
VNSQVHVSHPEISISECEPFFQKKLKFSKGFRLFPFEMILFEFIFNLNEFIKLKDLFGVQHSFIWIVNILKQIIYFEFSQNHSKGFKL